MKKHIKPASDERFLSQQQVIFIAGDEHSRVRGLLQVCRSSAAGFNPDVHKVY
jgi:hypothetical protein